MTGVWNDVRFGIPNACDAYGIIYRTDIFEQEGIKVDPENWTWDEYAKIAEQLTKGDVYGIGDRRREEPVGCLLDGALLVAGAGT